MWVALFYGYCLRVRIGLGHPPTSIAEHAGLQHSWHNHTTWWVLVFLAYATPVWSFGVVVGAAVSSQFRRGWIGAALALPWLIWLLVTTIDPGGWFDWFMD
jgi:hypothetical protein